MTDAADGNPRRTTRRLSRRPIRARQADGSEGIEPQRDSAESIEPFGEDLLEEDAGADERITDVLGEVIGLEPDTDPRMELEAAPSGIAQRDDDKTLPRVPAREAVLVAAAEYEAFDAAASERPPTAVAAAEPVRAEPAVVVRRAHIISDAHRTATAVAVRSVHVPAAPTAARVSVPAAPLVEPPPAPAPTPPPAPVTEQVVEVDVLIDDDAASVGPTGGAEPERVSVRRSGTPPPPPDPSKVARKPPPPPRVSKIDEPVVQKRARQWWENFFSDDYLISVLPPTPAQIARQVDFVEASLGIPRGGTVLDVGCGLGLHARELALRGYLVVGLDLSLPMITRAAEDAQQQNLRINFLHTDIREIQFDGSFDAVICLGTTFGFFDEDSNRDVLGRLYQALKPGGRILLDVVNRDYVIGMQPNLVWFQGEGCVCMEESDFNYFNSRLTVKRTMMQEDGQQSDAEYSIRLYSLHELGQLMQQMGFRVMEVSGQEATRGTFFGTHSLRIVMLAERRLLQRMSTVMGAERRTSEVPLPMKRED